MKFNATYIQTISLKKTIVELADAKKSIYHFLHTTFNLIDIDVPLLLENNDTRIIDEFEKTRPVRFDLGDENKIAELLSNPSNWLRDMINKINLKKNEGIYTYGRFLRRDLPETPSSSIVNDEIIVQIKCDKDQLNQKLNTISLKIYNYIFELGRKLEKKYNYKLELPRKINFISAQELEYENPDSTPHNRELDIALEKHVFFLTAPGIKLNSGHIHNKISPELYDLPNYRELIFIDRINNTLIKPLQISILSNGSRLDDQINLFDLDALRSNKFYLNLMQEKFKVIELKFNIPKLMMFMLKKGHISELQPDIISDESNIINLRHKIERM